MIDVPRDVIDVLTQLLAFLGGQLALRGWRRPAFVLGSAVFHGGGTATAFIRLVTASSTLVPALVRRGGLEKVAAVESTEPVSAAKSTGGRIVRPTCLCRQIRQAEGGSTRRQRQALPETC